ncbi:hypothetical protein [Halomonas sp. YLGW01]|uniref:hypothetical protein n=1 Tax=Halomonas sp. YLGW01 TaxID=2773308 RepID=UPI001783FEBC|nr:hypothetical protein [Halomonas sp. YLGW01]
MMPPSRCATLIAVPLLCLASSAQALNWQAAPLYETIELASGFQPDPHQLSVSAGGDTAAAEAGPNCSGYVNGDKPDVDINYQAGQFPLTIYVESAADTTLVVYDADGNWHCNDDYSTTSGSNPALTWRSPTSGNYNVWVGTYESSGTPQAVIKVSERDPEWTGMSGGSASSGGMVSSVNDIEWGDNTSQWANDGECDDPRFTGPGVHSLNLDEDRYHDAADCRRLYEQGQITRASGGEMVSSANDIQWGDNTSQWANDGECDDPRFAGPGVNGNNLAEDRYHDAADCQRLYEQGQIYLQ